MREPVRIGLIRYLLAGRLPVLPVSVPYTPKHAPKAVTA